MQQIVQICKQRERSRYNYEPSILFKYQDNKKNLISMPEPKTIDDLYEENQKLGHRINYLNDENNFYRISINNIKKLNQNINKNLLTANSKMVTKNHSKSDTKNITESYTSISNKIQLKNLQMKVGNSKRRVDKMEKMYDGSISTLAKRAEEIEAEANLLSRELEYYTIQLEVLDKGFMADVYVSIMGETSKKEMKSSTFYDSRCTKGFRLRNNSGITKNKISLLEEQDIKVSNKLQQMTKEQKELKKQKIALVEKIRDLKAESHRLGQQVYGGRLNIRQAQASEVEQLRLYNKKEFELQDEILKQDVLLEEQYKINQEYKQKIMDRNEQEIKEIKVLQEEIKKCSEQVKEMRLKCDNFKKIPKFK